MKNYLLLTLVILLSLSRLAANHFTPARSGNAETYMNVFVYSAKIGSVNLQAGDEIAVFDGSVCVGILVLGSELNSVVAIQAGKSDASPANGYTVGNSISIQMWDASAGIEYSPSIQFTDPSGSSTVSAPTFTDNGSAFVRLTTQLQLTINLTAPNKEYDGSDVASAGYSVTGGTVTGDVTISITNPKFNTKSVGIAKPVTATISATGADAGNYNFTKIESTTANISAKSLTVTGAVAQSKSYDGTNVAQISGATLSGVISPDVVTLTNAGTGTISQIIIGLTLAVNPSMSITGTDAGNYSLVQPSGLTANITRASLTVTADAKTKNYKEVNPVLTFSYSGWATGESTSALTAVPVASTTVTTVSAANTYTNAITVDGGAADNYSLTYIAANFTVAKVALTVTADSKTKVYNESNPSLTFQYAGFLSGEDASLLTTAPTVATTADLTTGAGIQSGIITVSGGVDENYSFNYVAGNLTITTKQLTVSGASAQSKIYDGTAVASITGGSLVGIVNSDDVALSALAGQFSQSGIGTGLTVTPALTLSGTKMGNYYLTQPSGLSANITTKAISVSARSGSKECNQTDPIFTYTNTPELISGDVFSGSLTRATGTLPGNYTISQGTLALSSNYLLTYHDALFTIVDNAPVWVTPIAALNQTVEYSDASGLAAAQALIPVASDACDEDVSNIDKISGTFVPDLNCDQTGTYTNTWTVTDNAANKSAVFTQTIILADRTIPVIAAISPVELTVNPGICSATISYPEITVTDVCPDKIEFVSGLGKTASFPLGTTVETWKVTDKSGNTANISFPVIIKTYNAPPTITQVADISAGKNATRFEVTLTGINPTSGCSLQEITSLDAVAVNKTLITEIVTSYTKGSSTGKLILKFGSNPQGTSVINVTLKDNGGTENGGSDTKTMSFNVKIVDEDLGPQLTSQIPNQVLHPGNIFQTDLSTLFISNGNTITYNVTLADGSPIPAWLLFNPLTGVLSGTAPSNSMGNLLLTITATDNNGLATKGNFWFVVTTDSKATLSGSVLASNVEITTGVQIVLLSVGKNNRTTVVSKFDLNGSSMFMFSGLAPGSYLIKAVVTDLNNYQSLLNTYCLNTSSVTTATKINLGGEDNPDFKIEMLQRGITGGSYKVSGKVISKVGPASETNTETGIPVEGVDVVLKLNGVIVANTVTDIDGKYSMAALPAGVYKVEIENLGFTQSIVVPLTLSTQNQAQNNVNFTIWDTGTITNLDQLIQDFDADIYPNPSTGQLNIKALHSNDLTVEIYNLAGKQIFHKNYKSTNQIQLNLTGNTTGIYLVKISNQENTIVKKLILRD
jgi:hypothetical protein